MKSVAVVGGGPGGLVAAKTLLHYKDSPFKVTVFEKADKLGGLWNLQKGGDGKNGFLSPETPTNLSKFTVSFSDLSWDSVKLGLEESSSRGKHEYSRVPMFPKAWMAGQYLELYADRYKIRENIKFGTEVWQVERIKHEGSSKWRLKARKGSGTDASEHAGIFDYLIMASGFFAQPRPLPPSLAPPQLPSHVKVMHSSRYRDIDDLIPKGSRLPKHNKILVIGGGNSSGEVAGTVAQHISSALHAPGSDRPDLTTVEIVHVTPRPLYDLPPIVPSSSGKGFVPLDLRLYDFDSRPGKIESYGGKAPEEVMSVVHGFIRSMIGSDQSDLGAPALVSSGKTTDAAYVALSENYSEFVRSGVIAPIQGRVTSLVCSDGGLNAHIRDKGNEFQLDGIAAVIHASGYSPAPALDWLPREVLDALEYDAKSPRLPLILDMLQTYNSSVPELGFIGFYEGPYWGVMEMQARLLAELWAANDISLKTKDRACEHKDTLRSMRADMSAKDRLIPQYWYSDYLAYMEETAIDLGLQRNDHPYEQHQGPTSPARYLSTDTSAPEAARIVTDLQRTMSASKHGAFVARATFRALQGKWKLHRTIRSATATLPSGIFEGEALLNPRSATNDANEAFDREYLYSEQGTFTPDSGTSMQASRHYVYRYREADDSLSVWFVKADDPKTVDYLYHDLSFADIRAIEGEGTKQFAKAHADHLCEADMYKAEYEFNFRGISMETWKCKHTVNGPTKDYTSEAAYER